jgi:hypothetical protein
MMIDSLAAAARLAVETDKPVVGAPLADMGSDGETGLFMLLPVSAQATAHRSGNASMDGILGWVFARLAIEDMFVETKPLLETITSKSGFCINNSFIVMNGICKSCHLKK